METIFSIKDQIKTGDVLLVSTNSWLPKAIQFFQKKQDKIGGIYNHAMVACWLFGELFVIEATEKGIVLTSFQKEYIKKSRYEKIIGLRPKFETNEQKYGEFMLPYVSNAHYDFMNLVVYQAIKFITNGKVWLGEKKENDSDFICGEWAAFVTNRCNGENKIDLIPKETEIAPIDLFESDKFIHYNIK